MASRALENALKKVGAARRMRNNLGADELSDIRASIRQRAVFSAGVSKARFLDGIKGVTEKVLRKEMNPLEAREALREVAIRGGYQPKPEIAGTIKDLTSTQRLDLIVRTNRDMARGYGRFVDAQASLDEFPFWEFYRAEPRVEPRDWRARWIEAGGTLQGGKMVAPVNSRIWTLLSVFGLPYPPFDYNSGMSVRRMAAGRGQKLGLKVPKNQKPKRLPNFDGEQAEVPKDSRLAKQLLKDLGEGYAIKGGKIVRTG